MSRHDSWSAAGASLLWRPPGQRPPRKANPGGSAGCKRNDFVCLRLRSRPRTVCRRHSPREVSWLISPKGRGTSHLNCHGESERSQGLLKHFRTSERPGNSRELNWSTRQTSPRARSILICRNGRSPQRRYSNGSKNRMKADPALNRPAHLSSSG
jgi:hypothetical protein